MIVGYIIGIVLIWIGGFFCGSAYELWKEKGRIAKLQQDVDDNGHRIDVLLEVLEIMNGRTANT